MKNVLIHTQSRIVLKVFSPKSKRYVYNIRKEIANTVIIVDIYTKEEASRINLMEGVNKVGIMAK